MKIIPAILLAAAFALPAGASVQVPLEIRNPFEVPDPVGFKTMNTQAKDKTDSAALAKETAFAKVKEKLYALPVRGIVSHMKNANSGSVTILLGAYTVNEGTNLPPQDFELNKGIIRATSVTLDRIVFKVSIGLDTRDIVIPLAR
jgi:hypothetical protein